MGIWIAREMSPAVPFGIRAAGKYNIFLCRYAAGTVTVSRVWSGAEWVAELELQKGLKVQYRLVDNFYMDMSEWYSMP